MQGEATAMQSLSFGTNKPYHRDEQFDQDCSHLSDPSRQTAESSLLMPPSLLTPDPSPSFARQVSFGSAEVDDGVAARRRQLLRVNTMDPTYEAEASSPFDVGPSSQSVLTKKIKNFYFNFSLKENSLLMWVTIIAVGSLFAVSMLYAVRNRSSSGSHRGEPRLPAAGPQFVPRMVRLYNNDQEGEPNDQLPADEQENYDHKPGVAAPNINKPFDSEKPTERKLPKIELQNLMSACENGDVNTVRRILGSASNGREIMLDDQLWISDGSNVAGDRPLHRAARHGKLTVVKALLEEYEVQLEQRNLNNDLAIHVAAFEGHWPVVEHMLNAPAASPLLIESRGFCSQTPLQRAASNGKLTLVQLLAKRGAKLNGKSLCTDVPSSSQSIEPQQGDQAIHLAAQWGHAGVVAFLADASRDLLEAKNHLGRTPLLEAAYNGHQPVVELLLSRGANVLARDSEKESNAVHLATSGGHFAIVTQLTNLRHDLVESKDATGMTPFLIAVKVGNLRIIQHLLTKKGANLRAKTSQSEGGLEAVHLAAQTGNVNLLTYLASLQPGLTEIRTSTGDMPVHLAAATGHFSVVSSLLASKKEHVEERNNLGRTPLLAAAAGGHLQVVRYLSEKLGADVDARSYADGEDAGASGLHLAARNGHLDIIPYFLALRGSLISAKDSNGDLPIHLAAMHDNQLQALELLAMSNNKESLEAIGAQGRTPLLAAAAVGNARTVEFLAKRGANMNAWAEQGEKPMMAIHLAAQLGNLDVFTTLLRLKPELIDSTTANNDASIHIAAVSGQTQIVERILQLQPAAIESPGFIGRTPLQHAASTGQAAVVDLLIKKGANVHAKDSEFESTALHLAARFGHLQVVKMLLTAAPELLQTRNKIKDLPIHRAVFGGQLEVLKYLVGERGAEIEVQGELGRTPVLLACTRGSLPVVNYLIERGADLFAKDFEHQVSSLHLAAYFSHDDIVSRLIEVAPALLDAKDQHGHSPLEMAKQRNLSTIVATIEKAVAARG